MPRLERNEHARETLQRVHAADADTVGDVGDVGDVGPLVAETGALMLLIVAVLV